MVSRRRSAPRIAAPNSMRSTCAALAPSFAASAAATRERKGPHEIPLPDEGSSGEGALRRRDLEPEATAVGRRCVPCAIAASGSDRERGGRREGTAGGRRGERQREEADRESAVKPGQ